MAIEEADLIVIGSGQGGNPLAKDFAKDGKTVVLFERDRIGGSCVNFGCTPSKTFLASAHAAGRARRASEIGVRAAVDVDGEAVMRRVREVRAKWSSGSTARLHDAGVRVVHAEASFSAERTVQGGGVTVRAPIVLIDTGTTAAIPGIPGLEGTPYLTNHSFFDIERVPESIIVVGAGYIGLELGQGCVRLGARVDVVDTGRVMAREEADAAAVLQQRLERDGVRFHLSAKLAAVRYEREFTVTLADGTELRAETLLIAAGRTPNTKALNAAASAVELDEQGYVRVDEHLRTTCDGVYALGDVARQPAFTHVSWEDYRRVKDVIGGGNRTKDDRPLAYACFTEPQLGRVGLTLEQAKKAGYDAVAAQTNLSDDARGVEWNLKEGFFRIVVDRKTERILGATFVGYEAGELIHVIYAHMMNGATWRILEESVHVHPTFAEALPTTVRQLMK